VLSKRAERVISAAADIALLPGLLHNPGGLWDADVLADGTGNVRTTYGSIRGNPAHQSRAHDRRRPT
jgi:hypothetical protein